MSIVCEIYIKEDTGLSRINEPIKIGIPLPRGSIERLNYLHLFQNDIPQIFQIRQTAVWPDGSSKWALIEFYCSIYADETKKYQIKYLEQPAPNNQRLSIERFKQGYMVNTQLATFQITNKTHEFFKLTSLHGMTLEKPINASLVLHSEEDEPKSAVIHEVENTASTNGLTASFQIAGSFSSKQKKNVQFKTNLTFYSDTLTVRNDLSIINNKSAFHPEGTWDLGDPGSVYFNELRIDINLSKIDSVAYKSENTSIWDTCNNDIDICIYQESSGGENWCSNNHVNRLGKVPLNLKGYQVINHGAVVTRGLRASPIIYAELEDIACSARIDKFWQNFPTTISAQQDKLSLKLFPNEFPDTYELQGGEKKTQTCFLDFSGNKDALAWVDQPLLPTLPLSYYAQANVFAHMADEPIQNELSRLIQAGIEGQDNFYIKRETIDEYGWRNFGDLYADHEAEGHAGEQPLISHYNNQYDAIFGFTRQFAVSGDRAWFDLLDDLAKHVSDIDIYHTSADRDEYNGGLFWHTDHYLDALSCTHRTFSKNHRPEAYLGYKKGGGPGSEHCYTTGLLYHYYMTGAESSKDAVIQLTNWITKVHEGSGTLLERIYAFACKDFKIIKRLLSGEKKIPRFNFPLTRGTGNYINTLLDAYLLTNDIRYIEKVEHIVTRTIHPQDDLAIRNFHDIENTWSYTVLLQSLCRYLEIKESLGALDGLFIYARDSLITYSSWMLKYEHPYLDNSKILEYPNHTWVAQEIRKANILYAAHYYSPTQDISYLEKANYFLEYCIRELLNDKTRSHTRIIVILLQNIKSYSLFSTQIFDISQLIISSHTDTKQEYFTVLNVLFTFFTDLYRSIIRLSITNEIKWLSYRVNFFRKIFFKTT